MTTYVIGRNYVPGLRLYSDTPSCVRKKGGFVEDIGKYINEEMNKIEIKATETKEEFIFKTIYPFCVSVIQPQEILKKHDLEQALIHYFLKQRIRVPNYDGGFYYVCPTCHCKVKRYQAYCDKCGQHLG